MTFRNESMLYICTQLQEALETSDTLSFRVLNPDLYKGLYAGEKVERKGTSYIYRGYKAWVDLAELLFCKILTPMVYDEDTIRLSFEKLDIQESFHKTDAGKEKYGVDSSFFKIHKNEEPSFLMAYEKALENVKIQDKKRVLDLGINGADEFELIKNILDEDIYKKIKFTGIDYSASAIRYAQDKFPEENTHFIQQDINHLDELDLGKFDLIISIGTFQSPNINFKPFFMNLVQNYLTTKSAIILGFPNCRWMGGEMIYGAKVPNYAMSEMGMLYSDVIYCKKYLQQKKFRVTLTGKNYIFLTATKINIG